jgi:drug/metabolite transporter (DMT)-like permease
MKRFNNKKVSGYFNLALCILLWASIPVTTKKLLVELDNLQILFYSTILSTLVLGVVLTGEKKIAELKKYGRREYAIMFALGFLGNYFCYVLLYGALARTSAAEGFILAYTWPIMVLALSFIVLKEKITFRKLAGIAVSFFGIIITITKGSITSFGLTNMTGDLLAICYAFVFALFSVLGKKFRFDKTVGVFIYFLAALVFITPTVLVFSRVTFPGFNTWLWLIYNGVLVNGISYIFWFRALEGVETHIVSNLLYLTPFISLLYIALFLGDEIPLSAVAGLAVIAAGVLSQYANIKDRGAN